MSIYVTGGAEHEDEIEEKLRSWAQNEEMINSSYTKHGRDCNDAAAELVSLRAQLKHQCELNDAAADENDALRARLAEAEALLSESAHPVWIISTLREASVLQSRDRDRLKALVTRIDAFLAQDSATHRENDSHE